MQRITIVNLKIGVRIERVSSYMKDNTQDQTSKQKNVPIVAYQQVEKETIMIEIVYDMLFEKLEQNINSTD